MGTPKPLRGTPRGNAPRPGFTIGYDLGTVGAWVRVVVGVIASIALLTIDLADAGRAAGFYWATAGWLVAILGAYTLVYALLAPAVLPRVSPWVSTLIFYGPVVVLPYLDILPDAFRFALAFYVVLSIVLVLFIRYGGCEVVGLPALLLRRRHVVYCPWNAVDIVDKAIEDSRWSTELRGRAVKAFAVLTTVAALMGALMTLDEAWPLAWAITALVGASVVAAWVGLRRALARSSS